MPGRTHGHTAGVNRKQSPEYKSYHSMLQRCYNPKNPGYSYYGGRGITVCCRWRGDQGFERFLADMGARPKGTTLERRRVNGNYTPGNSVWADMTTQSNNKRTTHYLTYDGCTQSMRQWSSELGISYDTLKARIRRGWSVEAAFGDRRS